MCLYDLRMLLNSNANPNLLFKPCRVSGNSQGTNWLEALPHAGLFGKRFGPFQISLQAGSFKVEGL